MASNYPKLAWHLATSGIWQSDIDEIEEFYATMTKLYEGSGRTFFAITGYASLSIEVPEGTTWEISERHVNQSLRKAWLTLRHNHPTLASRVILDSEAQHKWKKQYHQFKDDAAANIWVEKTFVPVTTGQTGLEWANSDPPVPSLPTLFVIHPPHNTPNSRVIRRDLVFRSPHDIIDGIDTLIMLNNLISHASKAFDQGESFILPVFDGSEAANLSPSYRIAANIPAELTAAQKERLASILASKAEIASAATDVDIHALPYRYGAVAPGRHQRAALTLSRNQTTELLKACKAANATPTHVFHAAAAIAARDIQKRFKEANTVRYISYILRNERPSCLEPYSTTKHPAALYHSVSGQSLIVDMALTPASRLDQHARVEEFRSIVNTMRDFYHGVRNDKEHTVLTPYLWGTGIMPLPNSMEPLALPPPKTHPSVSISSMGCIDNIINCKVGAFQTHDAWVTGEELGNGYGLFLGTFNGKLCLSVAYNDAWHTEVDVLNYLNRCKNIVFEGLKLTSS